MAAEFAKCSAISPPAYCGQNGVVGQRGVDVAYGAGRLRRGRETHTMDLSGEKRLHRNTAGGLIVEQGDGRRVPLQKMTIGCDAKALQVQGEFA